jgi:hypothetical protein
MQFGRVRLPLRTASWSSPHRSDPLLGSLGPIRYVRRRKSLHRRREWRHRWAENYEKEVTQTVPIVFVVGTDPVKIGLQT